jgi:hypothetical protein
MNSGSPQKHFGLSLVLNDPAMIVVFRGAD